MIRTLTGCRQTAEWAVSHSDRRQKEAWSVCRPGDCCRDGSVIPKRCATDHYRRDPVKLTGNAQVVVVLVSG